jgi:predicted nucleic acid-binding protein
MEYLDSIRAESVYTSAITVGEVEYGISLLPAGKRRRDLEDVMYQLLAKLADRVLPVTAEIAERWGRVTPDARKRGFPVEAGDGLIAATALQHGLHVVTRNVGDFEPTGVLIINPWE